MIDARDSAMFRRFTERVFHDQRTLPPRSAGFVWFGYMEPGFSSNTYMHYSSEGRHFFDEVRYSDASSALFCDIPDDVDPTRAEHAAVVATYRVGNGRWSCWVMFGDEADEWRFDPGNIHDLAEKVSPL